MPALAHHSAAAHPEPEAPNAYLCGGPHPHVTCANSAADPTIYKVIKREMDSAKGVISQVIVAGKASGIGRAGEQTSASSQLQYVANVGLKVNHKLGGHNMRIRGLGDSVEKAPPIWSTKPTMLIGIDVSHPQSFDTNEPSIAGIVASMDKCALLHPLRTFVAAGFVSRLECCAARWHIMPRSIATTAGSGVLWAGLEIVRV